MSDQNFEDKKFQEACNLSKNSVPLGKIAEALDTTPENVLSLIAHKAQLNEEIVQEAFMHIERGHKLDASSSHFDQLKVFMPLKPRALQDSPPPSKSAYSPKYIFSYAMCPSSLFKTHMQTGQVTEIPVGGYPFMYGTVWCEMPGGLLIFTGGIRLDNAAQDAKSYDSTREYARIRQPFMLSARALHGNAHHDGCLYVIGGDQGKGSAIRECERLIMDGYFWEDLPPLPKAVHGSSVVVLKATESLFAFGGTYKKQKLDLIQRLSLSRLEWDILPLRLPKPACDIACFVKGNSKIEFVIEGSLYSLNGKTESMKLLKKLDKQYVSIRGPTYYYGGLIYCSAPYRR
mmetsp:Transcript_29017/g.51900  ORF Transcript_29017/g.51900 Transcript_29017/m.51900 type:complete len:345 (-) Transcript_29017:88-1122(-)